MWKPVRAGLLAYLNSFTLFLCCIFISVNVKSWNKIHIIICIIILIKEHHRSCVLYGNTDLCIMQCMATWKQNCRTDKLSWFRIVASFAGRISCTIFLLLSGSDIWYGCGHTKHLHSIYIYLVLMLINIK